VPEGDRNVDADLAVLDAPEGDVELPRGDVVDQALPQRLDRGLGDRLALERGEQPTQVALQRRRHGGGCAPGHRAGGVSLEEGAARRQAIAQRLDQRRGVARQWERPEHREQTIPRRRARGSPTPVRPFERVGQDIDVG
jgi:hypothetical protein